MPVWQVVRREEMVIVEAGDTGPRSESEDFLGAQTAPCRQGGVLLFKTKLLHRSKQFAERTHQQPHSLLFSTCSLDTTDIDMNF